MSFFKRAFSAAMQRREDLREEAFEKFDEDVERGLKVIEQASKRKQQSDEILQNRKQVLEPLIVGAELKLGRRPTDVEAFAAYNMSNKNSDQAIKLLEGLEKDAGDAQETTQKMTSTTSPLPQSQQMAQAFAEDTETTIRQEGQTPETMGSRVGSTILGTFLGRIPKRYSVSETVKNKFINTFEDVEQGQAVYDEIMNYRKDVAEDGDPAQRPKPDATTLRLLRRQKNKLDKFKLLEDTVPDINKLLVQELKTQVKFATALEVPNSAIQVRDDNTIVVDQNLLKKINKDKQGVAARVLRDFQIYSARILAESENQLLTGSATSAFRAFNNAKSVTLNSPEFKNTKNIFAGNVDASEITGSKPVVKGKPITKEEFLNMTGLKNDAAIRKAYGNKTQDNDGFYIFNTREGPVRSKYDSNVKTHIFEMVGK